MLNVRKVPNGIDVLESFTCISETEVNRENDRRSGRKGSYSDEVDSSVTEAQIQQLSQYVNLLSDESSIFNNTLTQLNDAVLSTLQPALVTIRSTSFDDYTPLHHENLLVNENANIWNNEHYQNEGQLNQRRSIVTVLTKALQSNNIQLLNQENNIFVHELTINRVAFDICSLDEFAKQNNLDSKQTIAFQTICSSFMLSFLNDPTIDITPNDRVYYQSLLERTGAKQQLLCV